MSLIDLAERGLLPDWLIRLGIGRLLAARLRKEDRGDAEHQREMQNRFIEELGQSPIATATGEANRQHYEVPSAFFQQVLGPRLKYSCCHFAKEKTTIAEAEEAMLDLFCQRADTRNGMEVLELGCGWGSLCLWIAEKYPAPVTISGRPWRERRGTATSALAHLSHGLCRVVQIPPWPRVVRTALSVRQTLDRLVVKTG